MKLKKKGLYIIGIILVIGVIAYAMIQINFNNNDIGSKNSRIYSDSKITFSIPSELERNNGSFGSNEGIILSKFENDVAVISITVVSSSTNIDYIWLENCSSTSLCGHEKYSQDYFNREYNELIKLHPEISSMSTKIIKDEYTLQNTYEKTLLINENIVFGTIVMFDTKSDILTRIVYSHSSDLNKEFESYRNTILESLKFN